MSRSPAALPPSSPVTTRVAGPRAGREHGGPGATSPVTVTAIEASRPRDRSPPTSQSAYSSHASRIPPNSSITQAASTSFDSVSAQTAARGLAAMAAMSLTFTAIAL